MVLNYGMSGFPNCDKDGEDPQETSPQRGLVRNTKCIRVRPSRLGLVCIGITWGTVYKIESTVNLGALTISGRLEKKNLNKTNEN
jgi:hypothetical protein